MDELIVRSLQGVATSADERELQSWRRASPRNDQRYLELARVWALVALAEPGALRATPPTAAELLSRADARAPRERAWWRRAWWHDSPRRAWQGAVAAGLLALAAAGGAIVWSRAPKDVVLGAAEFVTGDSQMVTAQLGDGSVVRLAPRSRLRITGARGRRDVWLDGRAFFVVAKQPGRPFTVHTRVGEAVALGTRFEVNVRDDDLRLTTVEGVVALSAGGAHVRVEKGEISSVVQGAPPATVRVADLRPLLDWVGDFLGFQATPLTDVGREIERHYHVHVRIENDALRARTVTAWFSDESLDDVVAVVCRVVDAQCAIQDSTVEIRPRDAVPDSAPPPTGPPT